MARGGKRRRDPETRPCLPAGSGRPPPRGPAAAAAGQAGQLDADASRNPCLPPAPAAEVRTPGPLWPGRCGRPRRREHTAAPRPGFPRPGMRQTERASSLTPQAFIYSAATTYWSALSRAGRPAQVRAVWASAGPGPGAFNAPAPRSGKEPPRPKTPLQPSPRRHLPFTFFQITKQLLLLHRRKAPELSHPPLGVNWRKPTRSCAVAFPPCAGYRVGEGLSRAMEPLDASLTRFTAP